MEVELRFQDSLGTIIRQLGECSWFRVTFMQVLVISAALKCGTDVKEKNEHHS